MISVHHVDADECQDIADDRAEQPRKQPRAIAGDADD